MGKNFYPVLRRGRGGGPQNVSDPRHFLAPPPLPVINDQSLSVGYVCVWGGGTTIVGGKEIGIGCGRAAIVRGGGGGGDGDNYPQVSSPSLLGTVL